MRAKQKMREIRGRIEDKSHQVLQWWEAKSREFIVDFLGLFTGQGLSVSVNGLTSALVITHCDHLLFKKHTDIYLMLR